MKKHYDFRQNADVKKLVSDMNARIPTPFKDALLAIAIGVGLAWAIFSNI